MGIALHNNVRELLATTVELFENGMRDVTIDSGRSERSDTPTEEVTRSSTGRGFNFKLVPVYKCNINFQGGTSDNVLQFVERVEDYRVSTNVSTTEIFFLSSRTICRTSINVV